VDLEQVRVQERALPAEERLEIDVDLEVQEPFEDGPPPEAPRGVAEALADIGEAIGDAARFEEGPQAERIAGGPETVLNRGVEIGGRARRGDRLGDRGQGVATRAAIRTDIDALGRDPRPLLGRALSRGEGGRDGAGEAQGEAKAAGNGRARGGTADGLPRILQGFHDDPPHDQPASSSSGPRVASRPSLAPGGGPTVTGWPERAAS